MRFLNVIYQLAIGSSRKASLVTHVNLKSVAFVGGFAAKSCCLGAWLSRRAVANGFIVVSTSRSLKLIVADSGRISALSPRPAFEITSRQAAIGLLIGGERRFDRPTFRNNMLGKTRNHIT